MGISTTVSMWNGLRGHADGKLLTDTLKGTLGFKGFVISDYDGIDETVPGAAVEDKYTTGLNAGIDFMIVRGRARSDSACPVAGASSTISS